LCGNGIFRVRMMPPTRLIDTMEVYMVVCKSCGKKWSVSTNYVDDGRELICPKCGSPYYRWDATDEIEEGGDLPW